MGWHCRTVPPRRPDLIELIFSFHRIELGF